MRSLAVVLLFALIFNSSVRAQDSTRLERIEYVTGASLAFSLFDYFGYNLAEHSGYNWLKPYRYLQAAVQAAFTYFLYEKCGLSSAIAFNLIWWTWNDDIAYYGWTDLFNPPGPWENRSNSGLLDPEPYWAWWTPIGLLRPKNSLIARSALLAQAVIGFSVSYAIIW